MFGSLSPQEFLAGLLAIILFDLILSGDNAIVIALASRNLPPRQRKKAIFFGGGIAIALRVTLTVLAVYLLQIPFLQAIGGVLLVWIGIKLLTDEESGGNDLEASANMKTAIKTIVIADLIMCLDNVLAIAAASKGNIVLLIIGLAISIPIIIAGSQLLVQVMKKMPVFVYIGAGLIAYTAGELVNRDRKIAPLIYNYGEATLAELNHTTVAELHNIHIPSSILNVPEHLTWLFPVFLIFLVCGYGWLVKRRRIATERR